MWNLKLINTFLTDSLFKSLFHIYVCLLPEIDGIFTGNRNCKDYRDEILEKSEQH